MDSRILLIIIGLLFIFGFCVFYLQSLAGGLLAVIIILYDRRAKYEEDIMSHDNSYVDYLQQVKYRFVPGIY